MDVPIRVFSEARGQPELVAERAPQTSPAARAIRNTPAAAATAPMARATRWLDGARRSAVIAPVTRIIAQVHDANGSKPVAVRFAQRSLFPPPIH